MPEKPVMFKVGDRVGWVGGYNHSLGFAGPGPFRVIATRKAVGTCRHSGSVLREHSRPGGECDNPHPVTHPQVVSIGDIRTGELKSEVSGSNLRKLK